MIKIGKKRHEEFMEDEMTDAMRAIRKETLDALFSDSNLDKKYIKKLLKRTK